MKFPFSSPAKPKGDTKPAANRKTKVVVGVVASVLILATATAATFRSRRPKAVTSTAVAEVSPQTPATETRSKNKLEALPIQLKPGGFVPREITRPPGDYLFSVGNQSGVAEISLQLERERGGKLRETRIKGERLRWRQEARLLPGTYLITEATHPDWLCRIVIKPE